MVVPSIMPDLQAQSAAPCRTGARRLQFGLANEEHVNVISVDTVNQTLTAIETRNHPAGSSIRPSIWPTAVLLEGNDLAFDIKAVASPNAGSDLTVVIQT